MVNICKNNSSSTRTKRQLLEVQEANGKDVEHAFGVLQARVAIVCESARFFYPETLLDIMKACVILHNMIIEDEQNENEVAEFDYEQIDENPPIQVSWCRQMNLRNSLKVICTKGR